MTGYRSVGTLTAILLVLSTGGCALSDEWREVRRHERVKIYYRDHPDSGIPEFRAEIDIEAPLSRVMSVLTGFGDWPEWVYGCKLAMIVHSIGYREAYLYQVTELPLVRDRDALMHATISPRQEGDEIVIRFEAAPNYCETRNFSACREVAASDLVRIRQMRGSFRVRRLDGRVRVIWRQHLDPGGLIPDWVTRLMLSRVPVKSLMRLEELAERQSNRDQ